MLHNLYCYYTSAIASIRLSPSEEFSGSRLNDFRHSAERCVRSSRSFYIQKTAQLEHTSMTHVGFEPTIPVLERPRPRTLYSAVTVIGGLKFRNLFYVRRTVYRRYISEPSVQYFIISRRPKTSNDETRIIK
jgi:hypothetical protein